MITLNLNCFKLDVQSEIYNRTEALKSQGWNLIGYPDVAAMIKDLKRCGIINKS